MAALEEHGGRGRHDEPRHGDRQADRRGNRQCDVAEQLPCLALDEQDRQEHGDVCERAGEDRSPDLLSAFDGGLLRLLAGTPVHENILENDHRVVDQHADRERDAGEADYVERAVEGGEGQERAHHAHRDRHRHDQRGADVSQEEQERAEGEQASDHDAVVDEADGGIDVGGLVVCQRQAQPPRFEVGVDPLSHGSQSPHHVEDVGARLAGYADGDVVGSESPDDPFRLLGAEPSFGNVANVDGLAVTAGDDDPLDLLGRTELAECADHVTAFSLPQVAPGGVLILVHEGQPQVFDGERPGGEQLWIDDHLQFVLSAAHQVGARHAVDSLQAAFDIVLRHPANSLDVDVGGREVGELRVGRGDPPETKEGEVGGTGGEHAVKLGGEFWMGGLQRVDRGGFGGGLAEHQPGDRPVVGAGCLDHWPIGVDWPVANLLDPRIDLDQRLRHVGADGELELDGASRAA